MNDDNPELLRRFIIEKIFKEGKDYILNKFVCSCHFDDNNIKIFIEKNSRKGHCNYCASYTEVIDLLTLVKFICEKIFKYYDGVFNDYNYGEIFTGADVLFGDEDSEVLFLNSPFDDKEDDERCDGYDERDEGCENEGDDKDSEEHENEDDEDDEEYEDDGDYDDAEERLLLESSDILMQKARANYDSYDSYDSDELFEEIGLDIDDDILCDDIKNCLCDPHGAYVQRFCLKDSFYGRHYDTKEEELSYKWKQFCEIVTNSRRYTFFKIPEFIEKQPANNGLDNILSELGNTVIHANLIRSLEFDETLFRCRSHKKNGNGYTLEELASPPNDRASQNRMSPAGVSMFYGAFEPETAFEEIKGRGNGPVVTGVFEIHKPIKVVDFRNIPSHFSIFGNYDYYVMRFLKSFVTEIAKPVSNKNIKYVPTQIITEYFRYVFKTEEDENIHGLIYQSAAKQNGTCCVLFFDNKTCSEYLTLQRYY